MSTPRRSPKRPPALYRPPYPRTLLFRVRTLLGCRVISTAYDGEHPHRIQAFLVSIVPLGQEPILRGHGDEHLADLLRDTPPENLRLRLYVPAWLSGDGQATWMGLPLSRLSALRPVKPGWKWALDEIEQRVERAAKKKPVSVILGSVSSQSSSVTNPPLHAY